MHIRTRVGLTLVAALALLPEGCGKMQEDKVRTRVNTVLEGIRAEGGTTGDKLNFAMLTWDGGQRKNEAISMEGVYDRFTAWCLQKDINRRIRSYEITNISIEKGSGPVTAVVSVQIEGRPLKMRVAEGERITWVD